MFAKLTAVVLFAILASPGDAVTDDVWTGFVTKWPTWIFDGLYALPQTLEDARSNGWTEIEGSTAKNGVVSLGMQSDPRYIIFFDKKTGNAIGFQIGILVKDVKGIVPTNYDEYPGLTIKKIGGDYWYTGAIWFQINENGERQTWYEDGGELIEIPTKTEKLLQETEFLKKNCIPTMGTHYYRVNSTTDCSTDFLPWSFLADDKEIIGFLFQMIGSTSHGSRKWNEDVPSIFVRPIIPDAPQCMVDDAWDYGIISIHTWLVKSPRGLRC